jgi:hypothetical protein
MGTPIYNDPVSSNFVEDQPQSLNPKILQEQESATARTNSLTGGARGGREEVICDLGQTREVPEEFPHRRPSRSEEHHHCHSLGVAYLHCPTLVR